MKLARILTPIALAAGIIAAPAALEAPSSHAEARGSMANDCAVNRPIDVRRAVSGGSLSWLIACGTGYNNVDKGTVWRNDFYVTFRTSTGATRQVCRQAGQWFYIYNDGAFRNIAIFTPTASC